MFMRQGPAGLLTVLHAGGGLRLDPARLLDGLHRGSRAVFAPPWPPAPAGRSRPRRSARAHRAARGAPRRHAARGQGGPAPALRRLLRGDVGRPRYRLPPQAAGHGRWDDVCDHLVVIDHDAPPRSVMSRKGPCACRPSSAPIGCCASRPRHARAASTRLASSTWRRCCAPILAAAFLSSAAPASCLPTATSAPSSCCGTASGRSCCTTALTSCSAARASRARSARPCRDARLPPPHRAGAGRLARRRRARPGRRDGRPPSRVDARHALRALPPLLKGYLRLGARIGEHAVVDWQFGTTDVLVVLPVEFISQRYVGHFGADAGRHAA